MPTYLVSDSSGEKNLPKVPTPVAGPRKGEGPMDTKELQPLVSNLITAAASYIDTEISPERAKATKYYNGEPFGNEEPGRSQFVVTEVRDGVQAVLPSILKVVFGAERVVEFRPKSEEDVPAAEQATDYVLHVFNEENPGFLHTLAVLKDGLIRKHGIFKWWWDDTSETRTYKLENVDQSQLELLAGDESLELVRVDETGRDEQGQTLHSVELKRHYEDGCARLAAVPPEELIYNREARSFDDALIVAHRTEKTHGELIAMGVPKKLVEDHGGSDGELDGNEEQIAREPLNSLSGEEEAGEANTKTKYVEAYCRIDYDGDGIAELRRICTIGSGNHVVSNEPADEIPFGIFTPDPEPHTMTGQSWADRLMDMQRLKSALMRSGLDSLAASIYPRTWYVEGDANLSDILNTAIGAPIRTRSGPNAVGEFTHTFTGKEAFGILTYTDEIIERRTGQNKGAQGLDADALQSSTRAAVAAAVSASQAQQEMLVRIFAEGALKALFRGLLRLLVKHQPRSQMIKLRNQWVAVDPRSWNADMDVTVNVTLGSGLTEEKVQTLLEISAKQAEIIAQMGPQNPIVGVKQYRDTLAEIAELRGRKDATRYFKPITADDEKRMADEAANTPPPETPEEKLAKAQIEIEQMKAQSQDARENQKIQKDLMMKQAELAMNLKKMAAENEQKRIEMKLEDDRERDRMAQELVIKRLDLELKYQAKVSEQQVKQETELMRATVAAGPDEGGSAGEGEEAPAAKKPRRRKHVTFHRDEQNPDKIAGATIEEEDVED